MFIARRRNVVRHQYPSDIALEVLQKGAETMSLGKKVFNAGS